MKMSGDHQGRAVGGAFGQPEFQGWGQKCLSVHITCAFDKQKYGKINKRKVQKIEKKIEIVQINWKCTEKSEKSIIYEKIRKILK